MTSYPDSGLNPGTPYYYQVRSHTDSGQSAFSSPPVLTITVLSTPAGLSTSLNGSRQVVVKLEPSDGGNQLHAGPFGLVGRAVGPGLFRPVVAVRR